MAYDEQLAECHCELVKAHRRVAQVEQAFVDLEREKDKRIAELEHAVEVSTRGCQQLIDQARADEREQCIKSLPVPMDWTAIASIAWYPETDFDYANGFNDAIEQSERGIRALGDE